LSGSDERDFLSRWSRLKRTGGEMAAQPAAPAAPVAPEGDAAPERSDAEILEEHGLPDPDSLGPEDDVSGFMARTIPDRLRNRALRRLWLRNPVLANLDELVDYGEDYTDAATVVAGLASAWQAGRGYLPDAPADPEAPASPASPARDAEHAAQDTPASDVAQDASAPEGAKEGPADTPPPDGPATRPAGAPQTAEPTSPAPPAPRRRRMTFRV